MQLTDFYTINRTTSDNSGTTFHIKLNPDHDIYKGHFPGQPVLPGVCTLQIIKECAQQLIAQKLQYTQILQCKYLRFIDPVRSSEITLIISLNKNADNTVKLIANGMCEENFFIKIKGIMSEC